MDIIFVAVHPPVFIDTITKIKPYIKNNTMLISLAPKILISKMKEILPENKSIARVNPSAPNVIGQGMNPITFSEDVSQDDKEYALELFGKIGKTFEVKEEKIEAYAVISAMGSTYFWFQLQYLMELGVQFGLDTEESKMVISNMMNSTVNALFFSDMIAEEVIDLVPVKPIGEYEEIIKNYYSEKLTGIFNKIRP